MMLTIQIINRFHRIFSGSSLWNFPELKIKQKLIITAGALLSSLTNLPAQTGFYQGALLFGGPGNSASYVNEVTTFCESPDGLTVAGGNVAGTINLNPLGAPFLVSSASTTNFSGFLAAYDTSQQLVWGITLFSPSQALIRRVSTDTSGNIYVAGEFVSSIDVDPGTATYMLNASSSGRDMFLAKYTSLGSLVWAFGIGGAVSTESLNDMEVSASGDIYITGEISDSVDMDPGNGQFMLPGTAGGSFFLARYNSSGQFEWAIIIDSSPHIQEGNCLEIEPGGSILAGMIFSGTVDADPSAATAVFTPTGSRDALFMRFGLNGQYLGAFQLGGTACLFTELALNVQDNGTIITAGRYNGNLDADPGSGNFMLTGASQGMIFTGSYSPAFSFNWAANTVTGNIQGNSLDSYPNGSMAVLVNGSSSATLHKFDAGGAVLPGNFLASTNSIYAKALFINQQQEVFIGGGLRGTVYVDTTGFLNGQSGFTAFIVQYANCMPAAINTQSSGQTLCQFDNAFMYVNASGTGLSYAWFKDGIPIPAATGSHLIINSLQLADSGFYTCVVTGACGTDTSLGILLDVELLPVLTISYVAGQLQTQSGLAFYQWYCNGLPTGLNSPFLSNPQPCNYTVLGITNNGCTDTSSVFIFTNLSETLNSDLITIQLNDGKLEINSVSGGFVEIYNAQMQLCLKERILPGMMVADINSFSSGIYFVSVSSANRIKTIKMVK